MRTVSAALGIVILCAAAALAQPPFEPAFRPGLSVARAAGTIALDGVLDDPGWRGAGRVDAFTERWPGDNIAPRSRTEAWITYDDDYLYVGFRCEDDPAALRATLCQRDQFNGDDAVGFYLDTFGEAQWAYVFWVNPYGIQKDLMWTNVQGEDRGFDLIWHSAARLTDSGYSVEIAVPFASMRFPEGESQSWRLDLRRNQPRDSYHNYAWAAWDRDDQCGPCQWGTVEGIVGIRAGRGLEILPSFIAYQTSEISDPEDAGSGLEHEDVKGQGTLGAKYSVTSDVTVEGTWNPDFSQIEADADQIDVNTTIQLRYPERRPFFQEGNDLFRTYFNSFYTRMVVKPEIATKGTARWTKTSAAYMFARDENSPYIVPLEERSELEPMGYSNVHVLRVLHSLGNNSHGGLMITDRRYEEGGSGTIVSGDLDVRLTSQWSWIGQYVHSRTEEPEGVEISAGETFDDGRHTVDLDGEKFQGDAFITQLRRRADHWNITMDYNQVGPSYRTQTGYDPWNDQRNAFVWTNYNFNFEDGLIERISPQIFVNGRWNYDGHNKWRHGQAGVQVRLRKAQTGFQLNYRRGGETWGGVEFDDLWRVSGWIDSRPHDRIGWFVHGAYGENPALFSLDRGDELRLSGEMNLKPLDNVIVEPTVDYIRSAHADTGEKLFEQTILRARLRWQLTRRLSLRLVAQHNVSENPPFLAEARAGDFPTYHMYFGGKWEIDPLVTYRVNSFSVFYLGSTHDWRDFDAALPDAAAKYRATSRQYFMKLQYLFQI